MLINSISPSFYQRSNVNLSKVKSSTNFGSQSKSDEAIANQMMGQIKAMEFQNEDERIANLNNIAIEIYNKKPDIDGMTLINSAINYMPEAGRKRDAFVVELLRVAKYSNVLDKAQSVVDKLEDKNFGQHVFFSLSKYKPTTTNICGMKVSMDEAEYKLPHGKRSGGRGFMVAPKRYEDD